MRAPTIDYSATKRALSEKAQLQSLSHLGSEIENTSSRLDLSKKSLELKKDSQELSKKTLGLNKKSLDLNKQSLEIEKKHLPVQTGLSIASSVLDFAKTAVSVGNQIYKQNQADLVAAKTTDLNTEAAIKITEAANGTGNEIIEDDAGNFVDLNLDPALTKWFDDQVTAIENDKSLGKAAKQTMISNINQLRNTSKLQVYNQYINNKVTALEDVETDLLKKAVMTDVNASPENRATYGDYAAADQYIQNNKNWSAAQKQAKTIEAHSAIDLGRAKNAVQQVAITQGYDKAVELARSIQGEHGWAADSTEYKSLLSIAQVENANETLRLTNAASSAMTNGLNSMAQDPTIKPEDIYKQIEDSMEGQPQDRIDSALAAAKNAHISWATGTTSSLLANVTTQSRDELLLEQATLEEMNENGYFSGGAESVYTNAQKTIQTYIKAWDDYYGSAETASTKELAAKVSNIKAGADVIASYVSNGTISPESAVIQMEGLLSEYNVDGSYEDDLYIQKMIKTVEDNIVPAEYKDIVDNWMDNFTVQVANTMGYPVNNKVTSVDGMLSGLTAAQRASVDTAVKQAYAGVLSVFRQTASSKMSPQMVNEKLQSVSEIFTADVFSALGGGVKDANFFTDSNVTRTLNAFAEHQDIVYYDSKTGTVKWLNDDFEKSYNEISDWCAQDLEAKGIVLEGMPKLYTDENGIHPFPVFTTKAGTQLLYSNEGIYVLGTGEELNVSEEAEDSAKAAVEEAAANSQKPTIKPNFDIPTKKVEIVETEPENVYQASSAYQKAEDEYQKAVDSGDEEAIAEAEANVSEALGKFQELAAARLKTVGSSKGLSNMLPATGSVSEEDQKAFQDAIEKSKAKDPMSSMAVPAQYRTGTEEEPQETVETKRSEEDQAKVDAMVSGNSIPEGAKRILAIEGKKFNGDVAEAVSTAEALAPMLPDDLAAEVSPDCSISVVDKASTVSLMDQTWYDLNLQGIKEFSEDYKNEILPKNMESMQDKEYSLTPSGISGFFRDLILGGQSK